MSTEATASPALTKHDLETRLIEKCWKDREFRKQVLADPKGMFERQIGGALPADFKIVIHEDDANTVHFAIPPAPVSEIELSDEELERVAGGTEIVIAVSVAATVAIATASIFAPRSSGW